MVDRLFYFNFKIFLIMRNISIIKRIFSPPKVGIAICIIVMFAMMFNVRAVAATRADLPDKVEKAAQVSPDYTVAAFTVINEDAKYGSAFSGQQMAKSVAVNQEKSGSDLVAVKKAIRSIEDLQAIVPPLIVAQRSSIMDGTTVAKLTDREDLNPTRTMEVSVPASYIAVNVMSSLNVNQFAAPTADLKPDIQLRKPLISLVASETATSYSFRNMSQIAATTKAAKENDGQKNLQDNTVAVIRNVLSPMYSVMVVRA